MGARVLQITDLHLQGDPSHGFYGVNTRTSLARVLDHAAARGPYDAVVATGDLSDDGSPSAYSALRDALEAFGVPSWCVPGNHDDAAAMKRHLESDAVSLAPAAALGPWDLRLLDSHVPGSVAGRLGADRLSMLAAELAGAADRPQLLCLHHGPHPVCPKRLCNLEDAREMLELVDAHPNVRGVAWGHNHCEYTSDVRDTLFMLTPSTCVEARHPPQDRASDPHVWDPTRVGYRIIELEDSGAVTSRVEWLTPEGVAARSGAGTR